MKTKQIMTLAIATIFAMTLAGEAMARGGNGSVNRNGAGIQTQTSTRTQTATTRPEEFQRRDGTFLTTGTTANGSTTRPDNGNGLRDGSGLRSATSVPVEPATVSN